MPLPKHSAVPSRFITLATVVLVVAVLRVAEEVMIPVALSLLLAFLLSPVVVRLTRWRLPKTVAIILTATLAFLVIATVAWQIALQAMSLLEELPRYEENVSRKIAELKKPDDTGSLSRAFGTLEKMWGELQATDPAAATGTAAAGANAPPRPVAVEVRPGQRSAFEVAQQVLSSLFEPLGTAGIVVVLVIAILFQREDLRSRFIRVVSGGQLNVATEAVDDAAQRVSRYLLAQLLVNTCFGLTVAVGLYFIGVPHAGLWGLLSTLLRFIPFLGPLIAVVFPLVLSVAVDPGWTMLFWTAGLFIAAELVTNNVVEVLVYGTSTGISTLALLFAAIFWSWLWGMPGLFLSTPLTVCLLVIGQYVPGLRFFGVLLGSEPPLEPSAQFYQCMLSMEQEDLFAQAENYLEHHTLGEFYDDVFVPALLMSEVDRHKGVLAEVRQRFIFESSQELIEELGERSRQPARPDGTTAPPFAPPARPSVPADAPVIIGVPARDEADELVALMLAHLLRENGFRVRVNPVTAALESQAAELSAEGALVFISALPPSTLSAAARACRRLKEANPRAKIVVGVWHADGKSENLTRRLQPAGADGIAMRLSDAIGQFKSMLAASPEPRVPEAETPAAASLERTENRLSAAPPEDAADTVMRELARAFDVPVSLVCVVETDRDFWTRSGSTAPMIPAGEKSVYVEVLSSDAAQVVEDIARHERFASHALLSKRGVKAFMSVPLRTRVGHLVGNLCVLDTKARNFSDADRELLQSLAAQLMETMDPVEPSPPASAAAT